MEDSKKWYLSKTIWSGITTSVLAVLMACGAVPQTIANSITDEATLVLLGIATIYSRVKADKKIVTPTNG